VNQIVSRRNLQYPRDHPAHRNHDLTDRLLLPHHQSKRPNYHPVGMWYHNPGSERFGHWQGPDTIPDWGVSIPACRTQPAATNTTPRGYNLWLNQFFASTYLVNLNNVNGGNRPIEDVGIAPKNYVGTLGWTRTISSVMVNEARFNFTRFNFDQNSTVWHDQLRDPQIRLFDFDASGLGDIGTLMVSANPAPLRESCGEYIRVPRHAELGAPQSCL